MEVTTVRSFGFSITHSFPPRRKFHPTLAKKKDNESQQQQPPFSSLRISNSNLARAAIGVFGLGFIDAGYSGDWSRIGVITPQNEEFLRLAAFLVVPICVLFVFRVAKEPDY
ncbi:uncharacterized protein LOC127138470 [Lathyrus oleraceus]|uniref:DUF7887 domain-containing protein n=1 Tax=Pisum sativum TaxID=3888 RepID=A0A9D4X6R6_PEA|nr:uncharacterized protein LOC127138470 [Pisum sativum]KAI5414798.1 hypothetical protein KIW84_040311 [Pisum sativum]